jgi:hypothetical protein
LWKIIRAARSAPSLPSLLRLLFGQQLLAPDRGDHTPAAALIAGLGPKWQAARDRALAVAERAIMELSVSFTFAGHAGPSIKSANQWKFKTGWAMASHRDSCA